MRPEVAELRDEVDRRGSAVTDPDRPRARNTAAWSAGDDGSRSNPGAVTYYSQPGWGQIINGSCELPTSTSRADAHSLFEPVLIWREASQPNTNLCQGIQIVALP